VVRVSESGLECRDDVLRLAALGVDAFLVGHALLLSGDPGRKLRELNGREAEGAVRVKICGLTTPEDARLCHQRGADLLGVIFARSPRRVEIGQAQAIRSAVPDARLCGVFRDEELALVAAAAAGCGLDLIQLHGGETPEYCRELAAMTGMPLIKALTPDDVHPDTVRTYESVEYFLLDQPKTAEGSARSGDLGWRSAAQRLYGQGAELILAGGLEPANINDLATGVRPFAVDVCRGVESAPGRKDPRLVSRFLQEVGR
jgi:phosphoribosylanthranilate isomerase